ncbi:MAG: PilW family protein [Gammaproteobacteria bacterium]
MSVPADIPVNRRAPPRNQAGISLVELLVALALSIFLIAGVAVMYFSSSQSYRVQQQGAQLAQRERLAATFVGSVVQSAGYYDQPGIYNREAAFPASAPFALAGQSFYGTDGSYTGPQGDSLPSDTLTLRMLPGPDDQVLNCLGERNTSGIGQLYVNQLYLDTADQQLQCALSGPGIATQTQPILDGVTSLQFLYGVDTNGGGSADEYLDAAAITDWGAVRSITMILGFSTHNAATGAVNTVGAPVYFRATFPVRITSQ